MHPFRGSRPRNFHVGNLLLDRVLAAAKRGVRVRLLIDDWNQAGHDRRLAWLGARPNIEVRPNTWPGLDIHVSKAQRRTALAIMDRLFKALESRDLKIEAAEGYSGRGTFAASGRDKAQLSLSEAYKKVEHVPTAKELREKEKYSYTRIPKWDDVPTGKLTLKPGGPVDLSSEEAVRKLIDKAVAEIEEQIAQARESRQKQEQRQHEEYQRQQAEREEKARAESLHKAAKALHEYRLLMEYIEEVRRFGHVPDDQRREGQSLDEWLEWAQWQARQVHPMG